MPGVSQSVADALQAIGVRGVSITALLFLLAAVAWASRVSTAGHYAGRAVHDAKVVAVTLLVVLLLGWGALFPEAVLHDLRALQSMDWRGVIDAIGRAS